MPEEQQEKSSDQPDVGNQPGLDELIPLNEAAEQTGISASHLRLLVRRNEIWGRKLGRNWVTTKKAVDEYLAHEHKPGPKPGPDNE